MKRFLTPFLATVSDHSTLIEVINAFTGVFTKTITDVSTPTIKDQSSDNGETDTSTTTSSDTSTTTEKGEGRCPRKPLPITSLASKFGIQLRTTAAHLTNFAFFLDQSTRPTGAQRSREQTKDHVGWRVPIVLGCLQNLFHLQPRTSGL